MQFGGQYTAGMSECNTRMEKQTELIRHHYKLLEDAGSQQFENALHAWERRLALCVEQEGHQFEDAMP